MRVCAERGGQGRVEGGEGRLRSNQGPSDQAEEEMKDKIGGGDGGGSCD